MTLFIGFDLLDRQVLDRAGEDVGKVDDVELTVDDDGTVRVTALLVGPLALGPRLGGWLGGAATGIAGRLHPGEDPGPTRIPYDLVAQTGAAITLTVRRELLTDPQLETWLREHLIRRIPGSEVNGG